MIERNYSGMQRNDGMKTKRRKYNEKQSDPANYWDMGQLLKDITWNTEN